MDDQLHFSQDQDPLQTLGAFDSTPHHHHSAFSFHQNNSSTTWPLLIHTMHDHNAMPSNGSSSHSPSSATLDMDIKSSMTSPMPSLRSPAFDVPQPSRDSTIPQSANGSTALGMSPSMATSMATLQLAGFSDGQANSADMGIRTTMATSQPGMTSHDIAFQQALDASATMLQTAPISFQLPMLSTQQTFAGSNSMAYTGPFDLPLHSSPTDEYLPATHMQSGLESFLVPGTMDTMAGIDSLANATGSFQFQDLSQLVGSPWQSGMMGDLGSPYVHATMPTGTPESGFLESRSFSNRSDSSWIVVPNKTQHGSLDSFSDASVSPHILHVRADSASSNQSDHPPLSAHSHASGDEIFRISPDPEPHAEPATTQPTMTEYPFATSRTVEPVLAAPVQESDTEHASSSAQPIPPAPSPGEVSSSSSTSTSPKTKRRTSPSGITPKIIAKKKATGNKEKPEKRVGRRRGPLKPEQRLSAHEIRKLRACLRCKFLKKVCDKSDPCTGCQPSHARLWQVPCTRLDIKDIGFFLKDWHADYERHVTLGFSIANIMGFDTQERLLYVTHGYGFFMPVLAREVFVQDESCFDVDWMESIHESPRSFEVKTAKLSAGATGISHETISDYVDLHLDRGFDHFVNEYFEGTPFLSELLKSINRYYMATHQFNIRRGLRLVIAYALTLHITLLHGLTDEEAAVGRIEDPNSRYYRETCAPVMINFQVKKAMADLWRELMREVLEDLSALYSSVYSGEKFKNWPTIFMLAALILSVWEMMQFDSHYRVPEEGAVTKFCNEMEQVPIGVIVGLFGAISTKLPTFLEWDAEKHGNVWGNDPAVCGTLTDVQSHVLQHENYLKTRPDATFDRSDFDCLSNKFLSKLVIRA